MAQPPVLNPNVDHIPSPAQPDPRSQLAIVRKLTDGFQSLAGQRGGDRAVLFSDLVAMGIVSGGSMPEYAYGGGSGGAPGAGGGIPEAPQDGYVYGRLNGAWVRVLGLVGGTLTGPLILFRDPQQPMEAVTKRYADSLTQAGGSNWDAGDSAWDAGASEWDKGALL